MARLTTQSYVKITLIALLAILIFAVAGFGSCSSFRVGLGSSELSQVGSAEVDATSVNTIEIDWAAGTVDVVAYDGSDIVITEYSNQDISRAQQMRWGVSGNTLKIDYGAAFGCTSFASKRLEVKVPTSMAKHMEELDIEGASGDYTVNGITCNSFKMGLASGSFKAVDMNVGNLKLDAASGNSFFEGQVSGEVKVDVASGQTQVICKEIAPASIDADMASGTVIVSIPENDGFTAWIEKASGHFESDFATQQNGETYIYKDGSISIKANMASGQFILKKTD